MFKSEEHVSNIKVILTNVKPFLDTLTSRRMKYGKEI